MKELFKQRLYKNHGKTIGWWEVTALGDGETAELKLVSAKTMDATEVVNFTPVVGKNIGRANETSPGDQAVLEAKSRVLKQLDKGYVENIDDAGKKATNASGDEMPQLATAIDKIKPEKLDWENAFAQPKLDGHRALYKNGRLYSRQGKPINLPHILEAIKAAGMEHMHLDGELYVHGVVLQDIGSLVKAPREESKQIQYHIYDLVSPAGFELRYNLVSSALKGTEAGDVPYLGGHTDLKLVPTHRIRSMQEWDALHAQWLAEGFEGSIGRFGKAGYKDGKRDRDTVKRKDFDDHEYKVIGWRLGTPYVRPDRTYQVPVWLLEVEPKGKTFEATAAGTMEEKDAQAADAGSFLGRLLTIKHFGFTPDGIPNLPVALRWYEPV